MTAFMKLKLFLFCFLGLAAGSCTTPFSTSSELAHIQYTFHASVSSISQNGDILFIGLENGDLIVKDKDEQRCYSVGNNRIYDVYAYRPDSLFIGIRDEGLKLVSLRNGKCQIIQRYTIKGKDNHYAVYHITADRANRLLYLASSNGCYKLNLQNSPAIEELSPFLLNSTSHSGINKILLYKDILYVAADSGLYAYRPNQTQEFLSGRRIHNLILRQDTLYALTENAILKKCIQTDSLWKVKSQKYYAYEKSNDAEWHLAKDYLLYKKGQQSCIHPLPGGISVKGKQISLMTRDYFYVAYREELIAFPKHQNLSGKVGNVIAVTPKMENEDNVYFITSDLRLHKYSFSSTTYQSKAWGKIKNLRLENDIVRFVQAGKELFYLATDKSLYKIKNRKARLIKKFGKDENNDFRSLLYTPAGKLYVGTRRDLSFINTQKEEDTLIPIPVKINGVLENKDLYVTDLLENKDTLYFTTLNKGLFKKAPQAKEFYRISTVEKQGSAQGLMVHLDNLMVQTSQGIYLLDKDSLLSLEIPEFRYVRSIQGNPQAKDCLILYYHGLLSSPIHVDSRHPHQNFISFKDIPFHKTRVALSAEKIILGSRFGLFEYKNNSTLKPIAIEKETDYRFWGSVLLFIGSIFLIIAIYTLVIFQKNQKNRREQLRGFLHYLETLSPCIQEQVRREKQADLLRKTKGLSQELEAYLEAAKKIKISHLAYWKEKLNQLKQEVDKAVLKVKEQIEVYLSQAQSRLENIEKYPNILDGTDMTKYTEIVEKKNKIKTGNDYYTLAYTESLLDDIKELETICRERIQNESALKTTLSLPEIEAEIQQMEEMVAKNYKSSQIKKYCRDFIDKKCPELKKIFPFFGREKGDNKDRFYVAVLFFIPEIDSQKIVEALGLSGDKETAYINKTKYSIRETVKKICKEHPEIKENPLVYLFCERLKINR